jgi:PIN domain nuclease of toxin-antitoxin system
MRLLVDTHAAIWYVDQDQLLTPRAHAAITDLNNHLILSAASIWEMAIKVSVRKLTLSLPYRQWMDKAISDLGLSILPITVDYAEVCAGLPWHHRDPFDRLLIAQAQVEALSVVSGDSQLDTYNITRIW